MRGLLKAGLLLAPALASAFVVPERWTAEKVDEAVEHTEHISSACVNVKVPVNPQSESADFGSNDSMQFCLSVMHSEQNCGIANVAVNDQVLLQDTSDNGHSTGKGSIISDNRGIIVANWDFECVPIGDEFTVQLLKFVVEYVDGKAVENIGFTAAFTQTGEPQISRLDAGITKEDSVTYAGEISLALIPHDTIVITVEDFEDVNIEEEIAELEAMKAEARHLRHLIHKKERFIHRFTMEEEFEEDIRDCDSLKCIVKLTMSKARNAAHEVLSKIAGHGPHGEEHFDAFGEPFGHESHHACKGKHHGPPPPPPPPFPHMGKPKNGSHHNETRPHPPPPPGFCHCPPPHHGDYSHPPPHSKPGKGKGPKGGKGKKPHPPGKPLGDHEGHPPPPPPPPHAGPSNPPGDHHGPPPPPPAKKPEGPKGDHHGPPPQEDGEHRPEGEHHGPPPPFEGEHDGEHHDHHGPPPFEGEHHGPPPFDGEHEEEHHDHHGPPPFEGEHHGPPPFDGEHEEEHHDHHGPPPPFKGEHHGPPPPFEGEHHGPSPFDGEHEEEHHDHHGPPPFEGEHHGPPPFDGEHEEEHHDHHGPPPFDGEHEEEHHDHHGPPPPFKGEHHGPPSPFEGEHHGPSPFDGEHEEEHHEHHGPPPFDDENHGPLGEHHGLEEFSGGFEGRHGPPHHEPPHMIVLKFSAIGFVLAFLVIALHRRCCTPRSRAARQARREERHRRRAYRRAEHRNSLRSFFENLIKSQAEKDHEEKMALMEADSIDEVMRFRSGVVDIVAAEEGRFTDDELPAYEDAESSDGLVVDGMLYEPGSEYTPGSSDAGSLHDVLGVKAPVDTDKTSA